MFSQRTKNGTQKALESNKSRHIDVENDTPVAVEPMEVLFDTVDVPIPPGKPLIQKYIKDKVR